MTFPTYSKDEGYKGALRRKINNGEFFVAVGIELFEALSSMTTTPIFFAVNNVPKDTETNVNVYVATTKQVVANILCEGDNSAIYRLYLNNNLIAQRRSWFADFNIDFDLKFFTLNVSDEIKVTVEHPRDHVGSFSSLINLVTA